MEHVLNHKGSLMTYSDQGEEVCLGYLVDFTGHGIFDPTLGKVEVTKDEMEVHNRLLDEALIKGLDESCGVGQGGTFYLIRGQVQTFVGTIVSTDVAKNGKSITFWRAGKVYQGIEQEDSECFNFRRVA